MPNPAPLAGVMQITPDSSPLPPAGITRRLMCLVYEAFLLVAVYFIASFLALAILRDAQQGWRHLVFQGYLFAVGAAYFGWFWTEGRITLALKTWRLKIVTDGGSDLPLRTALIRYAAGWCGPLLAIAGYLFVGKASATLVALNFVWAFVDPDRKFLHDRIAGTYVAMTDRTAKVSS